MKTTEKVTGTSVPTARLTGRLPVLNPYESLFAPPRGRSLIQWPTEREILDVSARLTRIGKAGMRSETEGDYFTSGDLAYQMREIIQATAQLFKKSQRHNG